MERRGAKRAEECERRGLEEGIGREKRERRTEEGERKGEERKRVKRGKRGRRGVTTGEGMGK